MDLNAIDRPPYDFGASDLILMIGRQIMVVFLICMFFFLDTGPITSPFVQAQSLATTAATVASNVKNAISGTSPKKSKSASASATSTTSTSISSNNAKAAAAAAIFSK